MNYIKKIKEQINIKRNIRVLTEQQKIPYSVAEIMYYDETIPLEAAQTIDYLSRKFKVKSSIISDIALRYTLNNLYGPRDIYYEIGRKYSNEYIKKCQIEENVGKHIYKYVKKGISIDLVLKLDKIRIKKIMDKENISELEATYTFYTGSSKKAKLITDVILFNENTVHENDTLSKKIRNYILNSSDIKRTTIYGITLAAKTEEELNQLILTVEGAYKEGDKEYLETLSDMATNRNLIITNLPMYYISCYFDENTIIYLDKKTRKGINTFYHETTHFMYFTKKNYIVCSREYQEYSKLFRKIIERMQGEEKSKENIIKHALKINDHLSEEAEKYINTPKFREIWQKDLKQQYPYESKETMEILFEQKLYYERQKFIKNITYIIDIYDAMVSGKIYTKGKQGHGPEYFSDQYAYSGGNKISEFIAEIGTLYNSGGELILEYEFGEELAKEIIEAYQNLINNEAYQNKRNR